MTNPSGDGYLVTAVVSTYNSEKFIRGCLEDLEAQTIASRIEIIVIDSGSQENEGAIVKEFQQKYSNIVYEKTPKREGLYTAWNRGIRRASGKFITNSNTDDRHRPDALEVMAQTLEDNPEISLVYGDSHVSLVDNQTFEENDKKRSYLYPDYFAPAALLHFQIGPQPMWRRELHNTLGYFDESFKAAGDYDFNLRFALAAKALHIREHLGAFREHTNSITRRDDTVHRENKRLAQKWRTPALIEALYEKEGITGKNPLEKAKIHLDMGIRAMEYFPPWIEGKKRTHFEFALACFQKASEIMPSWISPHINIAVVAAQTQNLDMALSLMGKMAPKGTSEIGDRNFEILLKMKNGLTEATELALCPSELILPSQKVLAQASLKRPIRKSRILFVCHDFPPHRYAGLQNYALILAKEINSRGLAEVEVLHPVFRGDFKKVEIQEDHFEGLKIFKLLKPANDPFTAKTLDHPQVAAEMDKFLEEHHYDLVHFHSFGQLSVSPTKIVEKHGIPSILTLHDCWLLCNFWHLVKPNLELCEGPDSPEKCANCQLDQHKVAGNREDYYPFFEKYQTDRAQAFAAALGRIKKVFAVSKYIREKYAAYGHKGFEVAPLGLPPVSPMPRRPRQDKIRLLYVGQIQPHKGLHILIGALGQLPSDPVQLSVYGKSFDENYFGQMIEYINKAKNIDYKGSCDPKDLTTILAETDVVIIPSLIESYSLVTREAFQNKVPVIVSDAGALPEALEHGKEGLIFKSGNQLDLAEKILQILKNPALIKEFSKNIGPVREISEDARFYADQYKIHAPKIPAPRKKYSVQFYIYRNVHWPMFQALYEFLKKKEEVEEIVFCLPNLELLTGMGSDYRWIHKLLEEEVTFTRRPDKVPVDFTFVADTIAGKVKGCGKVINIGHGTISKGFYFTEGPWINRENLADLLCVPGPFARKVLKNKLTIPVVETGMPKLDPVFNGKFDKPAICASLGVNPQNPIILFAPTFNRDLSAMFGLGEQIQVLAKEGATLLIKLHGTALNHFVNLYGKLARENPDIIFIQDGNLAPYLSISDVLVSDVSSAMFEFMALDKPVVLYNSPNWQKYHGFDPQNIEYQWRDFAFQGSSMEEISRGVDEALENPGKYADKRTEYSAKLFSPEKGSACQNVWNACKAMISSPVKASHSPKFSVILPLLPGEENIEHILSSMDYNTSMEIELILVGSQKNGSLEDLRGKISNFQFNKIKSVYSTLWDRIDLWKAGVAVSSGDFLIYFDPWTTVTKNWLFFVNEAFKANPEYEAISPLDAIKESPNYIRNHINAPWLESPDLDNVGLNLSREYFSKVIPVKSPSLSFVVVKGALKNRILNTSSQGHWEKVLHEKKSGLALGFLAGGILENQKQKLLPYLREIKTNTDPSKLPTFLDVVKAFPSPTLAKELGNRFFASGNLVKAHEAYLIAASRHAFVDLEIVEKLSEISLARGETARAEFESELGMLVKKYLSKTRPPQKTSGKIVLYAFRELHIPVLIPIFRALQKMGVQNLGFMAPPFKAAAAGPDQQGISEKGVQELKTQGIPFWGTKATEKFACVVTADVCYTHIEGWGPIVCVGHGTISKGLYFTDTEFIRRENFANVLCVPGPLYVNTLGKQVFTHVVPTGFTKMDELAGPAEAEREKRIPEMGFDFNKKTLLFAPTFNPEFTSAVALFETWAQLDPTKYQVIIKLHGAMAKEVAEAYRQLAQQGSNLFFSEDSSIAPLMKICDILISDVSSAYVEFFALGKPVVLFNNPDMQKYATFNPENIEYKVRDAGYQFSDAGELPGILSKLELEDPLLPKRRQYAAELFPPLDGKNAERAAQAVVSTANGDFPLKVPGDKTLSVYIPEDCKNFKGIEDNLEKASLRISVFSHQKNLAQIGQFSVAPLEGDAIPPAPFIIMTGETVYPYGWDFIWLMADYFWKKPGLYGPMREAGPDQIFQQCQLVLEKPFPGPLAPIASLYKSVYFNSRREIRSLGRDGLIFSQGINTELISGRLKKLGDVNVQILLAEEGRKSGLAVQVIPGFFAYKPEVKKTVTREIYIDPPENEDPAYNEAGEKAYENGKIQEALQLFIEAVRTDNNHFKAFNNLGVIAWGRGEKTDAFEFFRKSLSIEPAYIPALENLIGASEKPEQKEEAKALVKKAATLYPELDGLKPLLETT